MSSVLLCLFGGGCCWLVGLALFVFNAIFHFCFHASFMLARHYVLVGNELEVTLRL